jgi:hypothetical protein
MTACVTGFIFYKRLSNSYLRYFPFYLAFIILSEATGWLLKKNMLALTNAMFFNYVVIPTEFLFFFWLFHKYFSNRKYNKLAMACMAVYIMSWIVDISYFNSNIYSFNSSTYTIGNLLLLILIFRFFIELITTEDILHFKSNMLFWISGGLLLFYLGTFPYFGLLNTLARDYPELHEVYRNVTIVLNILMYLMFTFSFIWGKPNTKYSSS